LTSSSFHASGIGDLERLVQALLSPSTPPESLGVIGRELSALVSSSPSSSVVSLLSFPSGEVQLFGLCALQDVVVTRWGSLPGQDRTDLCSAALQALARCSPQCVGKAAAVLAEMAVREWPQHWPGFLDDLVASGAPRSALCVAIGVLVEEAVIFSGPLPAERRRTLARAVDAAAPMLVSFLHNAVLAGGEDALPALGALGRFAPWAGIRVVVPAGPVSDRMGALLCEAPSPLCAPAAEVINTLFCDGVGLSREETDAASLGRLVTALGRAVEAALAGSGSEDGAALALSLCESHGQTPMWVLETDPALAADFARVSSLYLAHPSLLISHHAFRFFSAALGRADKWLAEAVEPVIGQVLATIARQAVKFPPQGPSLRSDPRFPATMLHGVTDLNEFNRMFGFFRGGLLNLATLAGRGWPETAIRTLVGPAVEAVRRLCFHYQGVVDERSIEAAVREAETGSAVSDAVISAAFGQAAVPCSTRLPLARSCLETLLAVPPGIAPLPPVLPYYMSLVAAFTPLVALSPDCASPLTACLAAGVSYQNTSSAAMDEWVPVIRRRSALALVELGRAIASEGQLQHLQTFFEAVSSLLSREGQRSAERVSLSEALAAVVPCVGDPAERARFAEALCAPAGGILFVTEGGGADAGYSALAEACSTSPASLYSLFVSKEPLRISLLHAVVLLNCVFRKVGQGGGSASTSSSSSSSSSSPFARPAAAVFPAATALLSSVMAMWAPGSGVPVSAVGLGANERKALLGGSLGSSALKGPSVNHRNEPGQPDPLQPFLFALAEHLLSLVASLGSHAPQLAWSDAGALHGLCVAALGNMGGAPLHAVRLAIKHFLAPALAAAPAHLVLPASGPLIESVLARLVREWEKRSQEFGTDGPADKDGIGADRDEDEVVAEALLRDCSRDLSAVLTHIRPSGSDPAETDAIAILCSRALMGLTDSICVNRLTVFLAGLHVSSQCAAGAVIPAALSARARFTVDAVPASDLAGLVTRMIEVAGGTLAAPALASRRSHLPETISAMVVEISSPATTAKTKRKIVTEFLGSLAQTASRGATKGSLRASIASIATAPIINGQKSPPPDDDVDYLGLIFGD
jgi:hypothetical protein